MSECRCGSGLAQSECCIPEVAPVTILPKTDVTLDLGWVIRGGINSNGQLLAIPPEVGRRIANGLKVSTRFYYPDQLDDGIDTIIAEVVSSVAPFEQARLELALGVQSVARDISALRIALYATWYHQRQFLYRWSRLRGRYALRAQRPKMGFPRPQHLNGHAGSASSILGRRSNRCTYSSMNRRIIPNLCWLGWLCRISLSRSPSSENGGQRLVTLTSAMFTNFTKRTYIGIILECSHEP